MWGCGLKYRGTEPLLLFGEVTPYVGVWIEIAIGHIAAAHTSSPPMWGCGLKYDSTSICLVVLTVTPYVGVWIEI